MDAYSLYSYRRTHNIRATSVSRRRTADRLARHKLSSFKLPSVRLDRSLGVTYLRRFFVPPRLPPRLDDRVGVVRGVGERGGLGGAPGARTNCPVAGSLQRKPTVPLARRNTSRTGSLAGGWRTTSSRHIESPRSVGLR